MKRPARTMLLKRPASAVLKRPAALLKRPAALSTTTDSSRRFTPHPSTRIVAVGSGADGMGQASIADTIVALSGKEKPCALRSRLCLPRDTTSIGVPLSQRRPVPRMARLDLLHRDLPVAVRIGLAEGRGQQVEQHDLDAAPWREDHRGLRRGDA